MSTTAEKLQYTVDAIDAIGASIESKGESVDSLPLNQWASKIDEIKTLGSPVDPTVRYMLRMRVLTRDAGYRIIDTPIQAGDVIDLGEGQDVEASTGWDDGALGCGAHPAMEFQEWSSSAQIIDNKLYVPEMLYDNIHGGALYITADRDNYLVKVVDNVITYDVIPAGEAVVRTLDSEDILQIISFWGGDASDIQITYAKNMWCASVPTDYAGLTSLYFYYCSALGGINLSLTMNYNWVLRAVYRPTFTYIPYGKTTTLVSPESHEIDVGQFPDTVTYFGGFLYSSKNTIKQRIFLPSSITSIYTSVVLMGNNILQSLLLASTTPPVLGGYTQFSNQVFILVPPGSIDAYREATNWSAIADKLLPSTEENLIKFGYK